MEAIILAGGMGTRLRSVVSALPKPMAPVRNVPFLSYIFEYLLKQNVKKVILSTGYKHEEIESFYGKKYKSINIIYSIEKTPLGTGGAIKMAFEYVEQEEVFILNGDTYFDVDFKALLNKHKQERNDLTVALKPMRNYDRYGSVITESNRIIEFKEKIYMHEGLINGGIYAAESSLASKLPNMDSFSFEKEFLEKSCALKFGYFIADTFFIDIGIPEDYDKAQRKLNLLNE